MPPRRKTEDMSPPTMLRWLKIYLVEVVRMIDEGRIYKKQGLKAAKGLRYAIAAIEDSAAEFKKSKRVAAAVEYKDAVDKLSEMG